MLPPNFSTTCQKLRGISDVPPQRITDLEPAIRQLRQLFFLLSAPLPLGGSHLRLPSGPAAFWTVAQFLPATKLVKRKKHYCLYRVQLKVQAHHPVN